MQLSRFILSLTFITVLLCAQVRAQEQSGAGNSRAEQLAQESLHARKAWQYIRARVRAIKSARVRAQVFDLIDNPAPTYQRKAATVAERNAVLEELKAAGLITDKTGLAGVYPPVADAGRAPLSFRAAPGSVFIGYGGSAGHHAYPGGLAVHTAFNLRAALSYAHNYPLQYTSRETVNTFPLDLDLIVAAVTLHDVMKPVVLQWQDDGSEFIEQTIAATGAHHILGLAEMFVRGLPAQVIIATAAAHNPPREGELRKKVIAYLQAAAIIARVDPEAYGVLIRQGDWYELAAPARVEHFIVHLADSDYLFSEAAASAAVDFLKSAVKEVAGKQEGDLTGARFNWLRNAFLSQVTGIGSFPLLVEEPQKLMPWVRRAYRRALALTSP